MIPVKKQGPFEVFSRGVEEPWAIWRNGRPFKQVWTWPEVETILRGATPKHTRRKTKKPSHATKAVKHYTVVDWSSSDAGGDPTFIARDIPDRAIALALGEKHRADVFENYGELDERVIRIQK